MYFRVDLGRDTYSRLLIDFIVAEKENRCKEIGSTISQIGSTSEIFLILLVVDPS